MSGRPMSCSVNPTSGREGEFSFEPVKTPKKVMVIGGGVAGMEVARMAAIKGHKVTMYEKTDKLGGHLNEGSVPEFKDDIKRLLSWYERQLKKMRIKIYFKTTASRKLVLDEKPDFVMIATGSSPCYPDLPGIKNANVITSIDLLLGKKKAGNVVLIVGGGLDGCETAVWLAKKGKQVTLIEMLPELAVNVHRANRAMLLDMLAESQVNVRTNTRLEEVKSNGIMAMYKDSERIELPADTVVLATGLVPNRELYKSLIGEKLRFYELGDCREPRKIHDAILEGFMMAQAIGQ
jgi:2-enoate reductase